MSAEGINSRFRRLSVGPDNRPCERRGFPRARAARAVLSYLRKSALCISHRDIHLQKQSPRRASGRRGPPGLPRSRAATDGSTASDHASAAAHWRRISSSTSASWQRQRLSVSAPRAAADEKRWASAAAAWRRGTGSWLRPTRTSPGRTWSRARGRRRPPPRTRHRAARRARGTRRAPAHAAAPAPQWDLCGINSELGYPRKILRAPS